MDIDSSPTVCPAPPGQAGHRLFGVQLLGELGRDPGEQFGPACCGVRVFLCPAAGGDVRGRAQQPH